MRNTFMLESVKVMKGSSKSLPGFLAKHIDIICRWLSDYCVLFQKADDAYIEYLKMMERERRDQLVQDYVDIRVFLSLVSELKNRCQESECKADDAKDIKKDEDEDEDCSKSEEDAEHAVGEISDQIR